MATRHTVECNCPVCQSLARVASLVELGASLPGFLQVATSKVRALEGDLRDELQRFGVQSGGVQPKPGPVPPPPPPSLGGAATPLWPFNLHPPGFVPFGVPIGPPPKVPFVATQLPKGVGNSQPTPRNTPAEIQELKTKSQPITPPKSESTQATGGGKSVPVKEEPKESPTSAKGGLKEIEFLDKGERRRSKSRRRKRSRSRKRERKSAKKSESERVRSEEEEKGEKRSPSREELPRRTGGSRVSSSGVPRPPSHSPPQRNENKERKHRDEEEHPRRGEQSTGSKRQGPGWIGPIPKSGHHRWFKGKNKGVVKRAKQERYNERWK